MMIKIAGIVLAAGASTRMGEDKGLLKWHGRSFLEHVHTAMKNAGADPIRVVLGANIETVTGALGLEPGETVHNPNWEEGMLSSIVAGLDSLPPGIEGAVLWPVDHPCVSSALARSLIESFTAGDKLIALPVHDGRRGHPVLFGAGLFDELRAAPREVGARHVVRSHADDIIEVVTEEDGVLLNLNNRAACEKILSRRPPA